MNSSGLSSMDFKFRVMIGGWVHMSIQVDKVLDAKGLACPMPIVKTKKAMDELSSGQVVEVQSTDKGSLADMQGWTKNTGHQYLGTISEGDVLKHFIRKANPDEVKEEMTYPHTVSNEELLKLVEAHENMTILDVREPAEYAFHRIPGSISIPYGELENRMNELKAEQEIYVICHTGHRSDMACQQLTNQGFKNITNVKGGITGWNGPVDQNEWI